MKDIMESNVSILYFQRSYKFLILLIFYIACGRFKELCDTMPTVIVCLTLIRYYKLVIFFSNYNFYVLKNVTMFLMRSENRVGL